MNSDAGDTQVLHRVRELLEGRPNRRKQKRLVRLLREMSNSELNAVLEGLDVRDLVSAPRDRFLGSKLKEQTLTILTVERVGVLSLEAQVRLASALQRGHTDHREEEALRDLLVVQHGEGLTRLKNALNLSKGRHDLEGLVYRDIDNEELREEIVAHFRREGPVKGPREAKILSDIDDTAIARIHEERYPKGTVIPGVLAFYEALDMGPIDQPRSRGDLTFVTARPSDALGLVKGQSRRTLTEAGITDLSIMTGSWFNLATRDAMATKKVENISHYAELFPEYDLVFIGDSGQGDIVVAQKIVESHPDTVKACFIHDVVEMPAAEREALAAEGIWVVDTYVGAAVKAHQLGLISDAGLRDVAHEASALLDDIEWESPEQEHTLRSLMERDVAAV